MQFEGRRRSAQVPNLTPLIDIVFLLLIFFMLTSHFVQEEALDVALPEARSGAPSEGESRLTLVIDAQGHYRLDGAEVSEAGLEAALRSALTEREDKALRVRGDRDAPLGLAVRLLDAARRAGASGVDLLTEQP